MQLNPTYRALLRVIPDLSWVYRFIPQLGRGHCPWVHGLTKTGQKISRFLKKGLIKTHTWLSDSEIVSIKSDCIYQVSQSECTCPEWKYRISKGKGYRQIAGGIVQMCKHQAMQWLRQHDVSHFSESINTENKLEKAQNLTIHKILEQIPGLPEGIELGKLNTDIGYEKDFIIYFNYWKTFNYAPPQKKKTQLGKVSIGFNGELFFGGFRGFSREFKNLIDGVDFLMKYRCFKYEQAIEPDWQEPIINDIPEFEEWEIDMKLENCNDDIKIFKEIYPNHYKAWEKRLVVSEVELQEPQPQELVPTCTERCRSGGVEVSDINLDAHRDLFGDDMYPSPVKEAESQPIKPQNKPQKKWLSFSDLNLKD